jgi:preprotein translocase subunit SecG
MTLLTIFVAIFGFICILFLIIIAKSTDRKERWENPAQAARRNRHLINKNYGHRQN